MSLPQWSLVQANMLRCYDPISIDLSVSLERVNTRKRRRHVAVVSDSHLREAWQLGKYSVQTTLSTISPHSQHGDQLPVSHKEPQR